MPACGDRAGKVMGAPVCQRLSCSGHVLVMVFLSMSLLKSNVVFLIPETMHCNNINIAFRRVISRPLNLSASYVAIRSDSKFS